MIDRLEKRIAGAIPLHPNVLSALKLVVFTPLLIGAVKQVDVLPGDARLALLFLAAFAFTDYLDGTVARFRGLQSAFGRVFNLITDYPLLLALAFFNREALPLYLLGAKLGLDLLRIVLYSLGRGSQEARVRTGVTHASLIGLLFLSQGWASRLITVELVEYLLWLDVAFSTVTALFNLGLLQKRFIADALSGANLLCGIFSMIFAARGRFDVSLLFLMLGAVFDGFDGAAARKFGGTRWGVYSDDVADGVNYAVAPGVALFFALGGAQGWIIGITYSLFTIGRLVYFTLNKGSGADDPDFFCGVPSTVGGLVVLCALILFPERQAIIGLLTGVACIQMVSFDSHYRHLGRALASNRRVIYGMPFLIFALIAGYVFGNKLVPVATILTGSLAYGFAPTLTHFYRLMPEKHPGERGADGRP